MKNVQSADVGNTAYYWARCIERLGVLRVANITDFSVEVRNSENDPYFSRFLYGVSKFSNFSQILNFFDFFQYFLS